MRGKIKRIKELIQQNKAELIKNKVELEKIDEKVEQNLLKRHLIKEWLFNMFIIGLVFGYFLGMMITAFFTYQYVNELEGKIQNINKRHDASWFVKEVLTNEL